MKLLLLSLFLTSFSLAENKPSPTEQLSPAEEAVYFENWKGCPTSFMFKICGAPDKIERVEGYTFYYYLESIERLNTQIHNNTVITYQVFTTKNGIVIKVTKKITVA